MPATIVFAVPVIAIATVAVVPVIVTRVATVLLIIVIIVVVYVFIWIHDIPYMMAKKRNHPNLHAIHIACWLSLFTLHALWPFVFIWAIAQEITPATD